MQYSQPSCIRRVRDERIRSVAYRGRQGRVSAETGESCRHLEYRISEKRKKNNNLLQKLFVEAVMATVAKEGSGNAAGVS